MWLAPIMQLLVLAPTALEPGTDWSVSTQAMPQPIATRQTVFAIPFRIDQAEEASREPVEVQLWVSANQGGTWQLYSKVEPARRHFMFRAGADGEYWFITRTLDRSGQLRPREAGVPGLRVVVDTMLPKLQLRTERGEAGQITARWQIDEPHLKPDSLTVQYRTTPDGPWQPVAIGRRDLTTTGAIQTGEVTWWPQAGSNQIQVRAEVSDTAGNPAVSHARVDARQGIGSSISPPAEGSFSPWRAGTTDAPSTPWPADHSANAPLTHDPAAGQPPDSRYADNTGTPDPYGQDRYPTDPFLDAGTYGSRYSPGQVPPSVGGYSAAAVPTGSTAGNINPPIRDRYVTPGERSGSLLGNGLPPGERPRMVNSRQFELEYDVASAGYSRIVRVELWGTRDGGRTWQSFATDNDNRSPLQVTVDEEGIYGFRVVVTSGTGLGGRPPQSGDLPEIVIGVDLTKPTARITAAEQGTGLESGNLVVCWQADDRMLAARPVSLSFSENPGGLWTTIASGLENTGRYVWPIDNRLPDGIYLRLEVRDEAGNVGVFKTPRPVALDRPRPTARIRDVRPLGQSTDTPARRYYLR